MATLPNRIGLPLAFFTKHNDNRYYYVRGMVDNICDSYSGDAPHEGWKSLRDGIINNNYHIEGLLLDDYCHTDFGLGRDVDDSRSGTVLQRIILLRTMAYKLATRKGWPLRSTPGGALDGGLDEATAAILAINRDPWAVVAATP